MKYAVTHEDLPRLVAEMREGSTQARRLLMEAHVGLAFQEASEFDDDEALSEALCELVVAVDEFRQTGKDAAALSAFLRTSIRRACMRHTRGRGRDRDKRMEATDALDHCSQLTRRHHRLRSDGYSGRRELMEVITSVCESKREEMLVQLLAKGYNSRECAEQLKLSPATVSGDKVRLELRFGVQERLLDR